MMIYKERSNILIINKYFWYNKGNINIRRQFIETNHERLTQTLVYAESNLIDFDGNLHLIVDSPVKFCLILLIEIHPFYAGNSRKSKTLIGTYAKINLLVTKNFKK